MVFLRILIHLHHRFLNGLLGVSLLHGSKERHDFSLIHHHCTDSVDDFKVFQLGFLVAQLLELLLQVRDFLFGLVDFGKPSGISDSYSGLLSLNRASSVGVKMVLP
jgi:hypothetical protein